MLSSIGLPGLNGFVGEFLILLGSFATHRWWTVVAAAGVILAAALPAVGLPAGVPRPAEGENADMPDLNLARGRSSWRRCWSCIVFLGVYPKPVLERMEPSVDRLVAHVEAARTATSPEPARRRSRAPPGPRSTIEHRREHSEEEG